MARNISRPAPWNTARRLLQKSICPDRPFFPSDPAGPTDFEGLNVDHDIRVEAGHYRRERRQVWVIPLSQLGVLYQQHQWARLQSIVMVYRRRLWHKITEETQFFLTSLSCDT